MAGKGDVLRPMAVDEMNGVWPSAPADASAPCHKCGRETIKDERRKQKVVDGELVPVCYPRCP